MQINNSSNYGGFIFENKSDKKYRKSNILELLGS